MCFLHALSSSTHWVQAKMRGGKAPRGKGSTLTFPNPHVQESHSSTSGTYVLSIMFVPLHGFWGLFLSS